MTSSLASTVFVVAVIAGHAFVDSMDKSCFVCTKGLSQYDPNWDYAQDWKNLTQDAWQALFKDMVLEAPGPSQDDCVQVKVAGHEVCADLLTVDRMQLANDTLLERSKNMESSARKLDYMRLWPALGALRAWQKQKDYEKIFAELHDMRMNNQTGEDDKAIVDEVSQILGRKSRHAEIQSHGNGNGEKSFESMPISLSTEAAGFPEQPTNIVRGLRGFLQPKTSPM